MIDEASAELAPLTSTATACRLLGKSRATHYRRLTPAPPRPGRARPVPPNALSAPEREAILDVLHAPRFADKAVAQVWATLLDEGVYLASMATMYRLLRAAGESRERRAQASHPARARPELAAAAPNGVWSWDITKLRGPGREYYDLYVALDIFSRYVPHWLVAAGESAALAEAFLRDAIGANGGTRPAAVHADRGTSMTSKPVAQLLVDLGVVRSHSRPHVSNDNPYSEAAFKTLKYCPAFPERFGSLADARSFCEQFFAYYNHDHRHSALGWHTPASVHHGTVGEIRAQRAATLDAAYVANPSRFRRPPTPPRLPEIAWINQPTPEALIQTK